MNIMSVFEALRQIDDEMQTKIRRGQKSQLQTEQDIKQRNELPTELENVEKITAFMECFPEVKCNPYDAQNGDAEPVELDLCVEELRRQACALSAGYTAYSGGRGLYRRNCRDYP